MMLLFTFYQCMYLKTILLLTQNILSLLLDISYKIAFIAGKMRNARQKIVMSQP